MVRALEWGDLRVKGAGRQRWWLWLLECGLLGFSHTVVCDGGQGAGQSLIKQDAESQDLIS